MGGQNIKLNLLYIQSIRHNSGLNPWLRVLFFSPPISLPRSVSWTLYVPSEPLHGPFKLCIFLSSLSYLTSLCQELFRYGFLPSGRCKSNLSFCTVHSSFDSSSSIYPSSPSSPGIVPLWISAPRLPTAQTHRSTVHSSFDSSPLN